MNILITGNTGFLGRHLDLFLKNTYKGSKIYYSNTKENNLYNQLEFDVEFDYIFHLAAVAKGGDWCLKNSGKQWVLNQKINTNIISYWSEHQPQAKFIGIGTSCSYGNNCNRTEENYLLYEPEHSLYTYAYTKRMLYLGLDAFNKQNDLDYLYVVPPTLYGPGFDDNDSHFIYDIIRKCDNSKKSNTDIEIWGNGKQKRELLWVNDFIKILHELVFEFNHTGIVNISSGIEYDMYFYYYKVAELMDISLDKIYTNPNKYVGMKSNVLIPSHPIVRNFKYKDIEEGLKETVKYYDKTDYRN